MIRIATLVNSLLTVAVVGFSIWLQKMTPMMIRAGNFECFRDRLTDGERDAILTSAAEVVAIGTIPLVITNIAWIAIAFIGLLPERSTGSQKNL
ncbi:MAG: hypothetical protein WCJ09_00315 [Planctomycetota bacterium]